MTRAHRQKALLIYPRFAGTSFWNYRETCALMGAKYSAAPLGLITVAALLPPEWEVRLVNRNTEELRTADLDWADLVMTGGMLPQRTDVLHLIEAAHARGKPVVVGGPDATSAPEAYGGAEFRVLGEAEEVLASFVTAWLGGAAGGLFVAERFPDLTRSPTPRFDLLKLDQYLHVGVQFSRGCPFDCEFCNVIELNGRAPRTKTSAQVLTELDVLRGLGYRGHVDLVDDNLIGNRKAVKPFLRDLAAWLRQHGRPFEFSTEASLDLAADDELLSLLREANFFAVFVGIETPDSKTLLAVGKRQNVNRDIAKSVAAIHRAGIFVNAGFIIGFDSEQGSVAQPMADCIERAGIPVCMVGLLFALPGTRLTGRLEAEGRLDGHEVDYGAEDADQCSSGINFRPLRPRHEVLQDYRDLLTRIYTPEAYFRRARRVARELDRSAQSIRPSLKNVARDARATLGMLWRMGVRDPAVRAEWWRSVLDCATHNPAALRILLSLAALYLHLGPYSRDLVARLDVQIAEASATSVSRGRSARGRPSANLAS
ncbi:MAG TPA: radical SAM protein [Anaeromyxobacteraceae bacterium]|nr:radical SAM protein [Anaeromyxobacteraceae bacterium]